MFLPLIASFLLYAPVANTDVWTLTGTAHVRGVDQRFEFETAADLRYRDSIAGELSEVSGYDGTTSWEMGFSGFPHPIVRSDAEMDRLQAWVLAGELDKAADVKMTPSGDNAYSVEFDDGCVTATLAIDPATKQPHTLTYWGSAGNEVWTYSNYMPFGEHTFATHITHSTGADLEWFEVKSAKSTRLRDADFRQPKPNFSNTSFDPKAPSSVEVKSMYGYTFVHPLVDGKDVGWFFLDSGAGAMCIDSAVAKKLGLAQVGKTIEAGVVATVESPIRRCRTFQLGPVTIKNLTLLDIDLGQIAKVFKLQLAGICGFDYLSRVSLALDTHTPSLSIYKPGEAVLPTGAQWTHFDFADSLMCLKCSFEGSNEGFFTLDTGSGSTVDFLAPAVEKLGLLKGRKTRTVAIGGAGGMGSNQTGKLEWFEIGGNRINDLAAGFSQSKVGAFASPYLTGNVGAGILGRFNLILDYQNQRLALAPLSSPKPVRSSN